MALYVIMLGPPGSGKGTQAEQLAREYRLAKVSTGERLREAVIRRREIGRLVRQTIDCGGLVGDDLMAALVKDRLTQRDTQKGIVLDGFPRTISQAQALETLLADRGQVVFVYLDVGRDELMRRLSGRRICSRCGADAGPRPTIRVCARCGARLTRRRDDHEAVIRQRLQVFQTNTAPLVRYFRRNGLLCEIDGRQAPEAVTRRIHAAIAAHRQAAQAAR